jgi:hypothetical protein
MFLKHTDQNRFAQTASIGVGRPFPPCADELASAHPPSGAQVVWCDQSGTTVEGS